MIILTLNGACVGPAGYIVVKVCAYIFCEYFLCIIIIICSLSTRLYFSMKLQAKSHQIWSDVDLSVELQAKSYKAKEWEVRWEKYDLKNNGSHFLGETQC